jgi:hypothetical protein
MFAAQSKLMLFFATLSLCNFLVHGSEERALRSLAEDIDSREPRNKCRDWKFPKSTKSTKKTKSAESNQCICPCCSEDSCQDLMDAVAPVFVNEPGVISILIEDPMFLEGTQPLEGVNDGTGPFCAVGGATSFNKDVDIGYATLRDICLYDLDGNLDPVDGSQNLGDCCLHLGVEHSGGYCEGRRKRSRKLNRASASNERTVTTHKDGVTVEVKAAEPSSLDWIHSHVIEMKEHMEQDDVTGEWDLLFQAYFDNSHHIDMNCDTDSADSLSCKYSSQTQCGRDLISAHAGYHKEIADSIRNGGSHNIAKEQLKPDSCP